MESTRIQYAHNTFNAWIGCNKISDGCKYCYAEKSQPARELRSGGIAATGFRKLEVWGPPATTERYRTSKHNWKQPILWDRMAKERVDNLGLAARTVVFLNSLSDTFEEHEMVQKWQPDLWHLIEQTPNLLWLMFTKRPENIEHMLPLHWLESPRTNVWLGTTAENQEMFDKRVPILSKIPAMRRFVSIEPMLERIDIHRQYCSNCGNSAPAQDMLRMGCESCGSPEQYRRMVGQRRATFADHGIDWLLVGGESGPKARKFDISWALEIINTVDPLETSVFMKQLGSNAFDGENKIYLRDPKGGDDTEWSSQLRMRHFPKQEF